MEPTPRHPSTCRTATMEPNVIAGRPLELILDVAKGWSKSTGVACPTLIAPPFKDPLGEFS
jgi:hypothetical protein